MNPLRFPIPLILPHLLGRLRLLPLSPLPLLHLLCALQLLPLLSALALVGCAGCRLRPVETIEPQALAQALASAEPPLVIDVRESRDYLAGHIPGALWLRPDDLDGYLAEEPPPRRRLLVTVCYHGNRSQAAAAVVVASGHADTRSLARGMEGWRAASLPLATGGAVAIPQVARRPPLAPASWFAQVALVVAAFVFKPAYMLLTLVLAIWLWRQRQSDLKLVRWGLWCFLAGETFCLANYLFAGDGSDLLELLHGGGMLLMGSLVPLGLYRLADERVLRLSDAGAACAVQRLCKRCSKREPVACGLMRVGKLVAAGLALIALMPLCAPLEPRQLVMPVLGSDVLYRYTLLLELVQFRLYPLAAALLLLFAALFFGRGLAWLRRAELALAAGLGVVSFALMRFVLYRAYRALPGWGDVWEETTELLAIVGVGWILFVFRAPLGLERPPGPRKPLDLSQQAGTEVGA